MDMRRRFLRLVVIAMIGLGVLLVVQITMDLTVPLSEGEISYFNLLVDVAVGFFTIWGLYWAASELALKPDLRLIIGREGPDPWTIEPLTVPSRAEIIAAEGIGREGPDPWSIEPLECRGDYLIGKEIFEDGNRVSRVIVGLILENTKPKAARYVRIELWAHDVPYFKDFVSKKDSFLYTVRSITMPNRGLLLQFCEDLVVYAGGTPVYLGRIAVDWPQGTRPERITFVARLYSLDSEPKEVTISHPIRWIEEAF